MTPIDSQRASAPLLRDLRTTSHESGNGVNITEAEFNKMKASGQLDSLFKKHGEFSFKDLDTDRSGKINEYDVGSGQHSDRHFIRTGKNENEEQRKREIDSGGSSSDKSGKINSGGKENSNSGESSIGNNSDVKSNSDGKVVLQFGWSDTSTSKIDSALDKAGIDNFERSNSSDKGLGIAVVTKEQAEAFKDYAGDSKKVFANIQEAKGGIDSTDDLKVSFSESHSSGKIEFGGKDYGGIVTDDPSKVVSGSAKGQQKGDDALWSTDNGNTAKVQMWDGPGGRQYVTMDADIRI